MKRVGSLTKKVGLINTYRRFKIRSYLNKTLQKKRNRFFFTKYLYYLFFLRHEFYSDVVVLCNSFCVGATFTLSYSNGFLFLAGHNSVCARTVFKLRLLMFMQNIFIRTFKPITNTLRFRKFQFPIRYRRVLAFFKKTIKSRAGRNNSGFVTVLSKGCLKKRNGVFSTTINMWNRGIGLVSNIIRNGKKLSAVIHYSTGSVVIHPHAYGTKLGHFVFSSVLPYKFWSHFKTNCVVLLKFLLKFSIISNIVIGGVSKYATAAGTFCQVLELFIEYNLIKVVLPSKQVGVFSGWSFCVLGRNSNIGNRFSRPGKAGFLNCVGKKPKVRGVARNPVDHPHGGRTKTNQPEVSIWGWVAKKNK